MRVSDNTTVLSKTKSVCPVCLQVLEAEVVVRDGAVYLTRVCPAHGSTTTYLWPNAEHYQWVESFRVPARRPQAPVMTLKGCPQDCGLCANHRRHPTLVEIELTKRCNLRCPVCFMAAGSELAAQPAEPDLKAIEAIYKDILRQSGPQTSIQLTGGEPTVRNDLPAIVRLGRSLGIDAIEVNTNGLVVGQEPDYVLELANEGISGIYLQFDGLTPSVYKKIRGQDLLSVKMRAIEHCRAAGVQVVLAMTVIAGINDDQLGTVLDFALANREVIAGLAYQPAFTSGRFDVRDNRRLTMGDLAFQLAEQSQGLLDPYDLWPLGCSHPLCSSATYIVEDQGTLQPLTRRITPQEYVDCFDPDSPQGSVFADIAARKFPELGPGLSIVVMNYMDALSMDLQRLQECSMIVAGEDGRLIPFCAHHLNSMGTSGDV
jgi:uncharacterized radical SAM superfamily Fe-S cluster-containing enzyme